MTFWILVGVMVVLALAFVVVPVVKPGVGLKPLLIGGLVVVIPLVAILAYQKLGTPGATMPPQAAMMPAMPGGSGAMPPGMPGAAMPDKAVMNMDLGQLADRLAEKLKSQPNNADGWALLARTYVAVKRHKESIPAFEKASSLLPKDPNLMADYADALAVNNGGKFDKKSEDLIAQALKIDPANVKAMMLSATMAFNKKDYKGAIALWEKILAVPGLDAETTKQSKGSIEEARRQMSPGK